MIIMCYGMGTAAVLRREKWTRWNEDYEYLRAIVSAPIQ